MINEPFEYIELIVTTYPGFSARVRLHKDILQLEDCNKFIIMALREAMINNKKAYEQKQNEK